MHDWLTTIFFFETFKKIYVYNVFFSLFRPLVSDLNNVLSHPSIAFKFMEDDSLLTMWFDFLKVFQGMDLNRLVLGIYIINVIFYFIITSFCLHPHQIFFQVIMFNMRIIPTMPHSLLNWKLQLFPCGHWCHI